MSNYVWFTSQIITWLRSPLLCTLLVLLVLITVVTDNLGQISDLMDQEKDYISYYSMGKIHNMSVTWQIRRRTRGPSSPSGPVYLQFSMCEYMQGMWLSKEEVSRVLQKVFKKGYPLSKSGRPRSGLNSYDGNSVATVNPWHPSVLNTSTHSEDM